MHLHGLQASNIHLASRQRRLFPNTMLVMDSVIDELCSYLSSIAYSVIYDLITTVISPSSRCLDLRVHIRPSQQRYLPPYSLQHPQIKFRNGHFRLSLHGSDLPPLLFSHLHTPQLRKHLTPRTHDHAMSVAHALLIMPPALGGREDVRLCFDSPRAKQRGPVRSARRNRESGGVCQELGALMSERK